MFSPTLSKCVRLCRSGLPAMLGICLTLPVTAADLASPSAAAVDAAIATPMIRFNRTISGGAHTNGAFFGGASIALAVASYSGNTKSDSRLLQQIRYILTPGNEPTSNGGYPAQHERHATGMFVIAKNTPRIWNQLTAAEKTKIDLIMKATFIASAFTTSDNNPWVKSGSQQYTLDADSNVNRGWNPNYREGMLGGVLVGMVYFGGNTAASAILQNYNHSQFLGELSANNLPNIYETFNWKAANPSSAAPSATTIQNAIKGYAFLGIPLSDHARLYEALATFCYEGIVSAGLNNGTGINGAGVIASGAAGLPNKGVKGMLKEFDGSDANGPRSSIIYAYDGYRPHLTNQLCLIVSGYWPKGTAIETSTLALVRIGVTDLWYKAEKGYIGYAKGKSQGLADYNGFGSSRGYVYNRSLWDDVLKPYFDTPVTSTPPSAPTGLKVVPD